MANTTTENHRERPYSPSWLDRFNNWVETLPLPPWALYTGIAAILVLVQVLFLWLDGGLQGQALVPILIFNGLLTPFVVALIHHLDRQAVTALQSMRPALTLTEPEFDEFEYKLSNMPFWPALITGLIMLVLVLLMEQVSTLPIRYAALAERPLFAVVFHIVDKSSALLLGVFTYHTIRQLQLVRAINADHTRVSLFHLAPLQAVSRLTASTAVGLVAGIYGWMLINPDLLRDPVSLAFVAAFTALALAVFVWPLLGTHRQLQTEKARVLHELDLQFESTFAEFNRRFHEDDYAALDRLNGTIASLEAQHRRIAAIPTWPWRPETLRFALAAIALPLLLTVLQLLADELFGW